MKYITFLLSIFTFSNFIYAQQKHPYEIIGNVKNIPSGKVYMVTMKRTASNDLNWPIIDSAKVLDGNFRLHKDTILLEPSWATHIYYIDPATKKQVTLLFQNKYHHAPSNNLLLENTKMNIEGDVKDPKGLLLTGATETEISDRYGLLSPGTHKIEEKIAALKKSGNQAELTKAVKLKNDTVITFKKTILMLANQYPSSWMMMTNVYQNTEHFTPTELAEITQVFTKEVLQTPKGQKLLKFAQSSKDLVKGARFPAFSYKDANQKRISLNDVKGKNGTIVVFWASWCGPCREEIPELKTLYAEYKSKGINLVSISIDHNIKAWKKALSIEKMPWPNLSNLPGDKEEIIRKYNTTAIPAIFLLDAAGLIVMPNDYRMVELRAHLEKTLSK
ncbi:TlpA disulfide reductase family protein [Pedobacter gandavensis]|uniref:TlpA disulfide reductase family protein n=1 Tax=Pedobacter gandavensis TaxID=2679963 RepID=UPI002931B3B0|nr:TlpA disulfide reductase family protein [Pedobacter gandavensis]